MTRRRPVPLEWHTVANGTEFAWNLMRGPTLVATIMFQEPESPDAKGSFLAVYLTELRPFVRLTQAKLWVRDRVRAALKRWGSLERAEANFEAELAAILRRRVMASEVLGEVQVFGERKQPVARRGQKGGAK